MGINVPLQGMTPHDMMKMLGSITSVERKRRAAESGRKKFQKAVRAKIIEPARARRTAARSRISAVRQYALKQPQVRNAKLKAIIEKANNLHKKHNRGHMKYRNRILNILSENDRTNYMKSLLKNIRAKKSQYRQELDLANTERIWNTWRGIIANSYGRTPSPPQVSIPYVRRPSPTPSTGRTTPFPTVRTKANRNEFFLKIGKLTQNTSHNSQGLRGNTPVQLAR